MSAAEVFVNQENMALFCCPHCDKMTQVSVAKFKGKKHSLQIKCSCAKTFSVNLNFRKKDRKPTDLSGVCCRMPAGQPVKLSGLEDENCRVVNISFGGVGLRLHGDLQVQLGDILLVSFALDDKQQSELKRKIIVRHVGDNNYIGGEFNDNKDNVYEKTIGYYLMS